MNAQEFANIANTEKDFWWFRGMRRILFRMLDPLVSGREVENALEAGCGTGYFARVFAERYGWRVIPIDLSWEGLREGQRLGAERLVQADFTALPFPSTAFEIVMSLDVLVHLPRGEEHRGMIELVRVLAPGGLLILRVAALDILCSRHSQFTWERQRFTRRRLVQLVENHNVRVLRVSYANSLLFPVALGKFRLWESLLRKPPQSGTERLPAWLNQLLSWPLALEERWIGAGLNFPLGQSLILIGQKR